jgi:arginine-tRNA-protein transferase
MIPNKSQRRILNKSKHLQLSHIKAFDSDEHYQLYEHYINTRHKEGDMYPATRELFQSFLLSDWADTYFMEVRDKDKLIASAVYDRLIDGLSAVYTYFDPEYSHLSPGRFCILKEIEYAKHKQLDYLYLGYQIDDCDKMNYKNKYRPVEEFRQMQWKRTD